MLYLDSSAIVKLVIPEAESGALASFIRARGEISSCGLARVEVIRAVRPHGAEDIADARALLEEMTLIRLDDALLGAAADIDPPRLRALDAIHVAAATSLGADLDALVTYDDRMAAAAEAFALPIARPT